MGRTIDEMKATFTTARRRAVEKRVQELFDSVKQAGQVARGRKASSRGGLRAVAKPEAGAGRG